MKKVVGLMLSVALVLAMAIPTFAASASKEDIMNEIRAGVTVNGQVRHATPDQVKVAEDFLNSNNFSEQELSTLLADVKDAKATWAATGKLSFSEMTSAQQQELLNKATASAKKVGATLTFDGKTLKIVDRNGKVYSATMGGDPIKVTGFDMNTNGMVAVSAVVVVALVSSVLFATRKNLLGAK